MPAMDQPDDAESRRSPTWVVAYWVIGALYAIWFAANVYLLVSNGLDHFPFGPMGLIAGLIGMLNLVVERNGRSTQPSEV